MANFGNRIKEIRNSHHLTQKELAKKLNITTRQLMRYEHNEQHPPALKLLEMAEYFNISLDYLFGRTDKKEINK